MLFLFLHGNASCLQAELTEEFKTMESSDIMSYFNSGCKIITKLETITLFYSYTFISEWCN